jgi:23S rRNA pseudouridine2605 synthase
MAKFQKRDSDNGGERKGRSSQNKGRSRGAEKDERGGKSTGGLRVGKSRPEKSDSRDSKSAPKREFKPRTVSTSRGPRKEGFKSSSEGGSTRSERKEGFKPRTEGFKPRGERSEGFAPRGDKPFGKKPFSKGPGVGPRKKKWDKEEVDQKPRFRKSSKDLDTDFTPKKAFISRTERDGLVRINKYLSQAGIASRRDADELIALGLISVNGKVVTELGEKINPQKDVVKYDDRVIRPEQFRYVLLNKPKGFLTSDDDEKGRETVMSLIQSACAERIYPVGRMDKEATGLLLFTNDGDMAKRLTTPKNEFAQLYHVELSEKISQADMKQMLDGVKLEDGFVKVEQVAYVEGSEDKKQVGLRIHSSKNKIVRRMFETMGYRVKKLDRVMYAGLTKKDLPRGRYRHLNTTEIGFLKMIR